MVELGIFRYEIYLLLLHFYKYKGIIQRLGKKDFENSLKIPNT